MTMPNAPMMRTEFFSAGNPFPPAKRLGVGVLRNREKNDE